MSRQNEDLAYVIGAIVGAVLFAAFWVGVAYVAAHFIGKLW